MKLYYHPVSTTSRPVMLLAADHRIEIDYRLVDLPGGEHLQPYYASLNANQAVPLLEDGEFRLTESSAILKYLADRVGSPLYPLDLRKRARINERMDWINTSLSRDFAHGFVYPQIFPTHRRADEGVHHGVVSWGREKSLRWFNVLNDSILGKDGRFFCGSELSIADYLAMAYVTLGEAVHVDFAKWPNVAAWIARMKDRQHWATVNDPFYRYVVQPNAKVSFAAL